MFPFVLLLLCICNSICVKRGDVRKVWRIPLFRLFLPLMDLRDIVVRW